MYRRYSLYEIGDIYARESYSYNDSKGSNVDGGGDSSSLFTWNESNIVFTSSESEILFTNNVIYNFYALVKSE